MENISKILLVRFSSIGDIVLTTPVIRCIKNKYPKAEIHFLSKNTFLPVLANNPYLSKSWGINTELSELINALKLEKFDVMVDLHHNLRSQVLKQKLGIKTLSFDKLNFKKWLLTSFKINRLPKTHIVDRYLTSVATLGVQNDGQGLDFFINQEDHVSLEYKLPDLKGKFVVLVCGAAHETKNLDIPNSVKLLSILPFPVVLIGGKQEHSKGEEILKSMPEDKKEVFNLCGLLSLGQSASVMFQSSLVITPDTGMMHIAAALHKNIISIWGNTVPAFGMYPYMPKEENKFKIAQVLNLSCRPCSKIGYNNCPKKHFSCINLLDFQQIKNWTVAYLTCSQP